jgi:glycosyltransferase involved in cell wall biosynthesis
MNSFNGEKHKISIITVSLNSEKIIEDTILSVASQDYANKEHIIIDGASTDRTMAVVEKHKNKVHKIVSEPDKGIYDAMNKGINIATGQIIGILNSGDVYCDTKCLSAVGDVFKQKNIQAVFGNLVYVSSDGLNKIVRYYQANNFKPYMFAFGIMPPHPSFFTKKESYIKYGGYKTNYTIAADFELLTRLLKTHELSYASMPKVLVKMRMGGVSTNGVRSNWIINKEIVRACKENGIQTSMFRVVLKYFIKIFQLFLRPPVVDKVL